jgi:hypothetical protein
MRGQAEIYKLGRLMSARAEAFLADVLRPVKAKESRCLVEGLRLTGPERQILAREAPTNRFLATCQVNASMGEGEGSCDPPSPRIHT